MTPFIRELPLKNPLRAFSALEHLPYSLLLDSSDPNHPNARYSFVLSHPVETLEYKDGTMLITEYGKQISITGNPFDIIARRLKKHIPKPQTIRGLPPFQGGLAGYFGYDLARTLEDLPETAADNPDMPDLALGIYDQVLAFDHEKNQSWIITHAKNYDDAQRKQNHILSLVSNADMPAPFNGANLDWRSNFTQLEYEHTVEKIVDYIHAGDIFQANLSQRFDAQLPASFDSFAHYVHMRKITPAPFACYMNIGTLKIASASPERFITHKEGHVETNPIKGTRARSKNLTQDLALQNELLNSEKDNAENTMIVDLLRNDLSKTCEAHSIHVSELCALESFTSVHHLVSTIRATLRDDCTALDLLKHAFPGGSITGAPKIRAMEIIEECEPTRRGPYCGAFGYVGFNGTMDTNILIRTLIYEESYKANTVSLQVGGGIVADSFSAAEYQETLDKAQAIFASFEKTTQTTKNSTQMTG